MFLQRRASLLILAWAWAIDEITHVNGQLSYIRRTQKERQRETRHLAEEEEVLNVLQRNARCR